MTRSLLESDIRFEEVGPGPQPLNAGSRSAEKRNLENRGAPASRERREIFKTLP